MTISQDQLGEVRDYEVRLRARLVILVRMPGAFEMRKAISFGFLDEIEAGETRFRDFLTCQKKPVLHGLT